MLSLSSFHVYALSPYKMQMKTTTHGRTAFEVDKAREHTGLAEAGRFALEGRRLAEKYNASNFNEH